MCNHIYIQLIFQNLKFKLFSKYVVLSPSRYKRGTENKFQHHQISMPVLGNKDMEKIYTKIKSQLDTVKTTKIYKILLHIHS